MTTPAFAAAMLALATLALCAATFAIATAPAQGASGGAKHALQPLRAWGSDLAAGVRAGRTDGGRADEFLEGRIDALGAKVPKMSRRMRAASPADRAREVRHSLRSLGRSLDFVPPQLPRGHALYFFTAYQEQLERLAREALLDRAPTGLVLISTASQPDPERYRQAVSADSDFDGILDVVERDDDADGVLDRRDSSDQGFGIPDAFQLREDSDQDPKEIASRRGAGLRVTPCLPGSAGVTGTSSVQAAQQWLDRPAAERGCKQQRTQGHRPARERLDRLGVLVRAASVEDRTLRARTKTKRRTKLILKVTRGTRVVGRARAVARRGGHPLRARLKGYPPRGTDTLRVKAKRAGDVAVGSLRVRIGPQPPAAASGELSEPDADGGSESRRARAAADPPPLICPGPAPTTDTDGDRVCDALEKAGFDLKTWPADSITPTTRRVRSDSTKTNTDDDVVTVGTVTFALSDYEEWSNYQTGGVSSPQDADSDGDALSDVEELRHWGTNAQAQDTDRDSIEIGSPPEARLFDAAELGIPQAVSQPTSPTLADTDADSFSDRTELIRATNPRLAQVPEFQVNRSPTAAGIQIAIPAERSEQSITSTFTDEASSSASSDVTTDKVVHDRVANIKGSIDVECPAAEASVNAEPCIPAPEFHLSGGVTWTDSSTQTHVTSFESSSRSEVQTNYEHSLSVSLKSPGQLSATFDVRNTGPIDIQLRSLSMLAQAICLPAQASGPGSGCISPGQVTTLGTMQPVDSTGKPIESFTLNAGERKPFQFAAQIETALLQSVMANPSNISFVPSNSDIYTLDGRTPYKNVIPGIDAQTATIAVDYDDPPTAPPPTTRGGVESYRVATNVGRAWGATGVPTGLSAKDALAGVIGLDYATARNPKPASGRQILSRVKDRAAQPIDPRTGSTPGAWFVFGSAQGVDADTPSDFDDIGLRSGTQLRLSYLADNEPDGLFDRNERLFGTSDTNADTDNDGATGPKPGRGNYSSDFFEAQVGWQVPLASGVTPKVLSSPTACDGDYDGSPDGPGAGLPLTRCPKSDFGPEAARTTDPSDPDTNQNGIVDGSDEFPLQLPGAPVKRGSWTGNRMVASGGRPGDGKTWRLDTAGQTIAPKRIAVCGSDAKTGACEGGSGYYRLTWTMGSAGSLGISPAAADPAIGGWDIVSRQGDAANTLASLKLQTSELGEPRPYEIYFHLPGSRSILDLSYTHSSATPVTIAGLRLEPISSDTFTKPAFAGADPNPAFAGIALPGIDFDQDTTVPSGDQGIRIDQAAAGGKDYSVTAWGPDSGIDLPRGGYRVGFGLRPLTGPGGGRIATPSVTHSLGGGRKPVYLPSQEPVVPGRDGLIAPNPDVVAYDNPQLRYPLAGGYVNRDDLGAATQMRYINLLFEQRATSNNVGFPIAVAPNSPGLALDNVVLDVTPSLQGYARTGAPYSGAGFSAWSLYDDSPLVARTLNANATDPQLARTASHPNAIIRSANGTVPSKGFRQAAVLGTYMFPGDCGTESVGEGTIDVPLERGIYTAWDDGSDGGVHGFPVQRLGYLFTSPRGDDSSWGMYVEVKDDCPPTQFNQFYYFTKPG